MTKYVYKAHFLNVFFYLLPLSFLLIVPLLRTVRQYYIYGKITRHLYFLAALLFLIVVFSFSLAARFKIEVTKADITVLSGVILQKRIRIKKENITAVYLQQKLIDRIFNTAVFKISTAAATLSKPDIKIRLKLSHAKNAQKLLCGDKALEKNIKFPFFKILIAAALSSSAFTGIVIGVPVINRIGALTKTGISRYLIEQISQVTNQIFTLLPPVLNVVTVVFFSFYLISFISTLVKTVNFKLKIGKSIFTVLSGINFKKSATVFIKNTKAITVTQPPLMRIFKRALIRVGLGSYFTRGKDYLTLVPVCKNQAFSDAFVDSLRVSPNKNSIKRFLFLPSVYLIFLTAVSLALLLAFPYFLPLVLFVFCVFCVLIIYYYCLCVYSFKSSKICFGKNKVLAHGIKLLSINTLCLKTRDIGQIRILKKPFGDKKNGTCNIKLYVQSGVGASIKLKHLPYTDFKAALFKSLE